MAHSRGRRAIMSLVCPLDCPCVILKLFHPLVCGGSVAKLTDSEIRWMIRRKEEGRITNKKIARVYGITPRRLQQLWAQYRSTGQMPTLHKPGRPRKPPDPVEEEMVLEMWGKHHVCAVILEHLIQKEHGERIPHNRIHTILVKHGYAKKNPKKQRRRKWIRYERKHSMSLWHMDWYEMNKIDPGLGEWLLTVQDDSSRKIMGFGVFDNATSRHSVEVLEDAIRRHGAPDEIITDKGSQFWAVDSQYKKKGYNEFEKYLQTHGIRHILARTKHPQTNGKIERLFQTMASQISYHTSLNGMIDWYNTARPHMSLGMATPEEAFWHRMSAERMLGKTSHILYQEPEPFTLSQTPR